MRHFGCQFRNKDKIWTLRLNLSAICHWLKQFSASYFEYFSWVSQLCLYFWIFPICMQWYWWNAKGKDNESELATGFFVYSFSRDNIFFVFVPVSLSCERNDPRGIFTVWNAGLYRSMTDRTQCQVNGRGLTFRRPVVVTSFRWICGENLWGTFSNHP